MGDPIKAQVVAAAEEAGSSASGFVDQIKNFGLANWILIASLAFVIILLIVIVAVNMKIMKKYRLDLKKTRVARVVARVEVINGWCCAVVENRGQEIATNIKLKCKGSIMKYYHDYIVRCRVDDIFNKTLGKKFMLIAGDRKQVRLFPIKAVNTATNVMDNKTKVIGSNGDVNLLNKVTPNNTLEIEQVFTPSDAKVLKKVSAKQAKLAKIKKKQDDAFQKKADKVEIKRQNAIRKLNKKQGKTTHTSVIEQPDMKDIINNANIKFEIEYECIGYLMKNKYSYKHIDIRDYPEELTTSVNVLSAQNALLEQMIVLQDEIRKMIGNTIVNDKEY